MRTIPPEDRVTFWKEARQQSGAKIAVYARNFLEKYGIPAMGRELPCFAADGRPCSYGVKQDELRRPLRRFEWRLLV